jgi:hypothetical protein
MPAVARHAGAGADQGDGDDRHDDCANHEAALRGACAVRPRLTERQAIPMFG